MKKIGIKDFKKYKVLDEDKNEIVETWLPEIGKYDVGFDKVFFDVFYDMVKPIMNKKWEIVFYLIMHRNKKTNEISFTYRELSEDFSVSLSVVRSVISPLRKTGFLIKVGNGRYQINPLAINRLKKFSHERS